MQPDELGKTYPNQVNDVCPYTALLPDMLRYTQFGPNPGGGGDDEAREAKAKEIRAHVMTCKQCVPVFLAEAEKNNQFIHVHFPKKNIAKELLLDFAVGLGIFTVRVFFFNPYNRADGPKVRW